MSKEEVTATRILYEGASPEEAKKFIKTMNEREKRGYRPTLEENMALQHAQTIVRSVPYSPPETSHADYSQEDLNKMAEIASARIEADAKTILLEREKKAREKDKIALRTRGISEEKVKEISSPVEDKIKVAEAKAGAKRPGKIFFSYDSGKEEKYEVPEGGPVRELGPKLLEGSSVIPSRSSRVSSKVLKKVRKVKVKRKSEREGEVET